ncbi:hypothetical protein DM860_007023 [Cuscuta australis]|uniref:Reverse transcriptase zinc-binding domain-containing protein n=1 Tax=Cuscuta australis TaxID=267555 RepID=A0A328EA14_9ASTE|nr:hypothetical protein DM860_007023 [Cuscuta australis]
MKWKGLTATILFVSWAVERKPVDALKWLPRNEKCADCGAPDKYALNVLVHRNLGVHMSKAMWEPSIIALFRALGNAFPNSACEELLQASKNIRADEMPKRWANQGSILGGRRLVWCGGSG